MSFILVHIEPPGTSSNNLRYVFKIINDDLLQKYKMVENDLFAIDPASNFTERLIVIEHDSNNAVPEISEESIGRLFKLSIRFEADPVEGVITYYLNEYEVL